MGCYAEDVQLELMTDIDMFQVIEKGMRGGISYIANRRGEASNKYMSGFDPPKPSKHIMYSDAMLCIRLPMTYMVGRCPNACQQGDSSG